MDSQWKDTFHGEIEQFKDTIDAFDRGELDRKAYKGKSGGMGSYAQRDPAKHMLRLRMAGGRLTMERLKFIADAVASHQVGRIKLTTCQTIQLHDLSAGQVPQLMEQATDSAIYSRGGGGDNPRKDLAEYDDRSVSSYINLVLREHLERLEREKGDG